MKKQLLSMLVLVFAAITAFGKEGIYLEFKMTSTTMTGKSKTFSSDGNTRTEMMMNMAGDRSFSTVTLNLKDAPGKAFTINEKDKTYSEMDISKTNESENNDWEVTVVGKERVNNYNCVHVKVRYKKSEHVTEMWLSKEIPGYNTFTSVKTKYLGGAKFFNALREKGADGFVARMVSHGARGEEMQMDLVKAEQKNLDGSLFSLSGYTKTASTIGREGGPDMEKLKKMTPEERQKYIEEMKAKYKQH